MTAAEDYLRDVGFELRDLPWRTKRDLLSELRVHLAEQPAEAGSADAAGNAGGLCRRTPRGSRVSSADAA